MENLMPVYPEKVFDVTNFGEAIHGICCCMITRKSLTLEKEEMVLHTGNCCFNQTQRRPYAQLDLLEERMICCNTCAAINSDLAPMNEEGHGGIVPGCGCEAAKVQEIIRELNLRKNGRGKVAQMRQQKFMLEMMGKLAVQVPVLMKHFSVTYPPPESLARRLFEPNARFLPLKELLAVDKPPDFPPMGYDVTCACERLLCTSRLLQLEPDEAVLTHKQSITGTVVTTRVPYANIESVQATHECGCCAVLQAGELTHPPGMPQAQPLVPGCGCSGQLVEQMRAEFQARVDARGNRRQIQQLEDMMKRFKDLAVQLTLVQEKVGLDVAYPPSQETMASIYGQQGPEIMPITAVHAEPSVTFQTKEFNVRNEINNALTMLSSCGLAGCTTHKVVLEPEQMVETFSNNCTNSVERKPYANLNSVDEVLVCCCCRLVNGWLPGVCGDEGMVQEIAEELQGRKVGRGNIAQLRNQENSMVKALESDIRVDSLMKKQGVAYPPSQQTMQEVYGAQVPTLPPTGAAGQTMHLSASERMETKEYEITSCGQRMCCGKQNLVLNDEEAIYDFQNCCSKVRQREPYASLGSVEPVQNCGGLCVQVSTDQNEICPGCGCEHALVNEISAELQQRKVKRGNIAQIRQQENLMVEIIKLGVKLDLLLNKEKIQYPPGQAVMDEIFGQGAQLIDASAPPSEERRSSRSFMNVTVPAGLRAGDTFPVTGPTGRFVVMVPEGHQSQVMQVEIPRHTETELAPLAANAS